MIVSISTSVVGISIGITTGVSIPASSRALRCASLSVRRIAVSGEIKGSPRYRARAAVFGRRSSAKASIPSGLAPAINADDSASESPAMSSTVPRRRKSRDIDETSSFDVSTIHTSSHTPSAASTNDRVSNERGWYMYASLGIESP